MAKFKTTHVWTADEDQIGEGSEDAKGCITLRLLPMRELKWDDKLDLRLTAVVGHPNKATRRKK